MKLITNMDENEAKEFLLKGSSFFTLDLPKYFNFDNILLDVRKKVGNKSLEKKQKIIQF